MSQWYFCNFKLGGGIQDAGLAPVGLHNPCSHLHVSSELAVPWTNPNIRLTEIWNQRGYPLGSCPLPLLPRNRFALVSVQPLWPPSWRETSGALARGIVEKRWSLSDVLYLKGVGALVSLFSIICHGTIICLSPGWTWRASPQLLLI